ncbi:unnamed protein product [Lota lota]
MSMVLGIQEFRNQLYRNRKLHQLNTSKLFARSSCDTVSHFCCKFFTNPLGGPCDLPGIYFRFDIMAVSPPRSQKHCSLVNAPLLSVSCLSSYLAKASLKSA